MDLTESQPATLGRFVHRLKFVTGAWDPKCPWAAGCRRIRQGVDFALAASIDSIGSFTSGGSQRAADPAIIDCSRGARLSTGLSFSRLRVLGP
ncbi:hypothetical protein VTJ04DRAFT_7740 [Mycothermus thermophilus]|uniref:uncharacterized protein n=1 Tax=Humicola insolens TaxID=85995 RepID=UPI003743A1EB